MQFSYDNNTINIVAQTDEERGFLREVRQAFFEGSVTIEARNHKPENSCIECLSSMKYKDCVTATATFGMNTSIVKV